jgi:hypothetical protein
MRLCIKAIRSEIVKQHGAHVKSISSFGFGGKYKSTNRARHMMVSTGVYFISQICVCSNYTHGTFVIIDVVIGNIQP